MKNVIDKIAELLVMSQAGATYKTLLWQKNRLKIYCFLISTDFFNSKISLNWMLCLNMIKV